VLASPNHFMKTIYVYGIAVRFFWTGLVKVMTLDHDQCLRVLAYLNDEGMLEQEFFDSLA
jgi:hypothetical protein